MTIVMFAFLENLGQGHGMQHLQWFHSMANINLYRSHTREFFSLVLTVFQMFTFQNSWPWKYRLRAFEKFNLKILFQSHGIQFSQWRHSMDSVKNLQTSFFTFSIFAKVRRVRTKVTHRHTYRHTHTHTEKDRPIVIGEILYIYLKPNCLHGICTSFMLPV